MNDLVQVFKNILRKQYAIDGYIRITEDQGKWETDDPYLPITL